MQTETPVTPEFDQFASHYCELLADPMRARFAGDELHFHRRKWALLERMLERAGMQINRSRWMDVGCGRGELLSIAGSAFADARGCDPSGAMLSEPGALQVVRQPSPVELPAQDGAFDLVTAVCVFHHVHGSDRILLAREMRRVLRPGGLGCIIEHNPRNPVTRGIVKRCPVDGDAELLQAHETEQMLAAAGLVVQSTEYFLYLPERAWKRAGRLEGLLRRVPFGGQYAVLARRS